jgi:hypothetical protein
MKINRMLWTLILAILAFVGSAKAQATPPPVYHPGQTISVSVTFDGPDAPKIIGANMTAHLMGQPKPSQPEFQTGFGATEQTKTGPNTFKIDFTISDNQASGDYQFVQISATLQIGNNGRVSFVYAPQDYQIKTFTIENPNTVTKPGIKNITVH